ncbi:hypothetical protein [Pontixanthobacter sp.]|uniref:hypothetical protein n=1 Tax=Pontixanthobacter sp. TaxID=2792078 RepID=UPI003C7C95F2
MRIGSALLAPAILLASPLAAKAGDMNLAVFIPKAERLIEKGALALFSSDMKVLKGEVEGASADYRARITRDKAAGRTPHSCPPAKGSMNSEELMAHFTSYPQSRRANVTVRTAFFALMKQKYPC